MKYLLLYSIIAFTACQVNFNLFPKFEGKKKDEKAIGYTAVKKAEWEQYAGLATQLNQPEPAELVIEDTGVLPSAMTISPYTLELSDYDFNEMAVTKSPDTCTHSTILATASPNGYFCSCWDCGILWDCKVQ